jgi:hypothetical protein
VHASEFLAVPVHPDGVGQYTKVFVLSEKKEGQKRDGATGFGEPAVAEYSGIILP